MILERGNNKITIEIKSSSAPALTRDFFEGLDTVKANKAFVIAPVDQPYPIKSGAWVYDLKKFLKLDLG